MEYVRFAINGTFFDMAEYSDSVAAYIVIDGIRNACLFIKNEINDWHWRRHLYGVYGYSVPIKPDYRICKTVPATDEEVQILEDALRYLKSKS